MQTFFDYNDWRAACVEQGYGISRCGWRGSYNAYDEHGRVIGQWLDCRDSCEPVDRGYIE